MRTKASVAAQPTRLASNRSGMETTSFACQRVRETTTSQTFASKPAQAPPPLPRRGLGLAALTALVVGSMIGSGIFALPSQMAGSAAPGPLLIGWIITGVGMLMLAFVFQTLASRRPDVDGGVYGYARAGFGNYIGFTAAFGYWVSAWVGNVAYLVLLFSTLGYFFGPFEGGATVPAIICASILLWIMHAMTLRGIHTAAAVNVVVTIAMVIPIVVFVAIAAVGFKAGLFTADFWGSTIQIDGEPLGGTMSQVKNMMLITVWVFIGIEGASVYSRRAAKRTDVGRGTVLGFAGVLALLLLVNLLSYGLVAQAELAGVADPSMAGVLEQQVGSWGAAFISIGLVVSLLGALIAWVLLCVESLRLPAQRHVRSPGPAPWASRRRGPAPRPAGDHDRRRRGLPRMGHLRPVAGRPDVRRRGGDARPAARIHGPQGRGRMSIRPPDRQRGRHRSAQTAEIVAGNAGTRVTSRQVGSQLPSMRPSHSSQAFNG